MKININKEQLSDIYNLHFNVFYPLEKFVSKKEFVDIVNNMRIGHNVFFPIPVYFSLLNKPSKTEKIKVYYKNKYICVLKVIKTYTFSIKEKNKIGSKIFGTNDKNHPGFNKFLCSTKYFIDCKIKNFKNPKGLINFSKPEKVLKSLKKNKINSLIGFHTRNVPHRAHEWIHKLGLSVCKNLLIQPLIGQYREGEYKEDVIIKTNKYLVNKIYKKDKVFFAVLNSYPRYAGPREALFHALIRKNYGCTHFLVGRDHAGVGQYYGKYQSQKLCKIFEKKMGIKIITFKEPFLCKGCNKIFNSKCTKCFNNSKLFISGTKIRNKLIKRETILPNIMHNKISKLLSKKSIII